MYYFYFKLIFLEKYFNFSILLCNFISRKKNYYEFSFLEFTFHFQISNYGMKDNSKIFRNSFGACYDDQTLLLNCMFVSYTRIGQRHVSVKCLI